MNAKIFRTLILIGRPASGKSEFIHFMQAVPLAQRIARFHIGQMTELDDFPWLWEKFREDDLWERAGYRRRYSRCADHAYCLVGSELLDYCLARFNAEFPQQPSDGTVLVEFARGKGDGGYRSALSRLSDALLGKAAILYIHASFAEASRRNEARYQEAFKHSVLAHKVPEEDLLRFGRETDWPELTGNQPAGYVTVRGRQVPFVTMDNERELTAPQALGERYATALHALRQLYIAHREAL